jgi:multiple sugar transport system substrate-binding protein
MVLLLAVICVFAAACGGPEPDAPPTASGPTPTVTAPPGLPVTISIAGSFDDRELNLLDDQIAAFEALNPDVRVEVVRARKNSEARRQAFAALLEQGDSTRDIYVLDTTWLAPFAAADWLAPLDGLAGSHAVEVDGFLPATVHASSFNGQLMALPWTADAGLLYYRKDLLEKHGYEPPDTWAELQRIALELKGEESVSHGFVWQGAAYGTLTCNALEHVWAYGGDVLDEQGNVVFDSVETRPALQQMVDLISSGASPADVTAFNEGATLRAFQSDGAVFMRNGSFAWDRLQGDDSAVAGLVGIAPLPASCLGGESLALSAYSRHPDETFRFMAFLAAYEQQREMAHRGVHAPALETVYAAAELLSAAPNYTALHTALSGATPLPETLAHTDISEAIYSEVNRMLAGEQDAATTAANIQRRIEAVLR